MVMAGKSPLMPVMTRPRAAHNGGPNVERQRIGHKVIGVVEEVGSEVQRIKRGQDRI